MILLLFVLQLSEKVNVQVKKKQKVNKREPKAKKEEDSEMALEGNQKLNKIRKMQFKKEKKKENRQLKAALKLSESVEKVTLKENVVSESDNYNFEQDFVMK